jgi:hypothetical protein
VRNGSKDLKTISYAADSILQVLVVKVNQIVRAQARSECERRNPKSPSTGHHESQLNNILIKRSYHFKSFPLRTSASLCAKPQADETRLLAALLCGVAPRAFERFGRIDLDLSLRC